MNARARTFLGWGLVGLGVGTVLVSLPFVIADSRVLEDWLNPLRIAIVAIGLVWLVTGAMIVVGWLNPARLRLPLE